MFYSQSLLGKKGILSKIWAASFKKLKKEQVEEVDIASSIDQVINNVHISYRILAHLLLGIVKVFSKKVDYLEEDCKEALKVLTVSLPAIYWINPKKSSQHGKKNKDLPESSDANHGRMGSMEIMRAQLLHDGFSVPDSFELDMFDLGIHDDCDAPDTHQQQTQQVHYLADERGHTLFMHEAYQRKYDQFEEFCSTPIRDIIPMEMAIDLDVDMNELYSSNSSKKEKSLSNQEVNLSVDHESTQNTDAVNSNREDEIVNSHPPPTICQKEKKSPSKDKKIAPNFMRLETAQEQLIDPGLVSPKLTVQTPVKREIARNKSMKRKYCSYDNHLVLVNEIMREVVHDARDLVCKRRKAPRTALDIWREKRFKCMDQLFTEPLIPCTFSKIEAPFQSRVSEYSTPQRPKRTRVEEEEEDEDRNGSRENHADISDSFCHETGEGSSRTERRKRLLVEPVTEQNAQNDKSADISDSVCEMSEGTNLGFESMVEEGSTPDKSTDIELESHEEGDSADQTQRGNGVCSLRTRYVARHMREKFSELKSKNKESILSLEKILEGKSRKTSARFFYETLVLKGRGSIDVKQDAPYGDIMISESPHFDEQI